MDDSVYGLLDERELYNLPSDPKEGLIALIDIISRTYGDDYGNYRNEDDQIIFEYIKGYTDLHSDALPAGSEIPFHGEGLSELRQTIVAAIRKERVRSQTVNIFARKAPEYRVSLNEGYRVQIRQLIEQLRRAVDQWEIPLDRKQDIINRINTLSEEVEKEYSRLDKVAAVWLGLTRAMGDGAKNLEPAVRLLERVRRVFGAAQSDEEQQLLLDAETRKQIPAPNHNVTD